MRHLRSRSTLLKKLRGIMPDKSRKYMKELLRVVDQDI
jgi:hypothetical protein